MIRRSIRPEPSVRVLRLAAALPLLLASSALAEEPAPVTPELKALFEREQEPLPRIALATPGGITGEVEATAPVEVMAAEGGAERLTVKLGAEQPIVCTLSRGRVDAAASLGGMIRSVGKSLQIASVRPVEVSADGGVVVVFAELLYRQDTEKGARAGQLKMAVHPHGAHSLLCFHDEPGYSTTFRRVVKGLAASLRGGGADDAAQARFAEVLLAELGGLQVGYVERQIWEREGGGRVAITREAMLLPRSDKALLGVDEYTREESDASGLLTAVQAAHALDGQLDLDVQLSPGDAPRTFAYEGRRAGKAIEGTFRAREGLASELWFARRLAGKRPAARLVHETYSAGADPAAPTRLRYARDAKAPGRAALTVGPMTVRGELDEFGLMKALEIPLGAGVLAMKRVWSRGAP